MMSSVPQFIDVEDKIAGPLTWRQLLWMIGMGAILLVTYNMLPRVAFFILAVPVILIFCALAFYRPNNQPLIFFLSSGIFFLFRPKVAVWERPAGRSRAPKQEPKKVEGLLAPTEKRLSLEELKRLAKVIDTHGRI